MTITPQTVITFAALIAAVVAIMRYYNKVYDLVKHEKQQDEDIKSIKDEMALMTRGQLACLKALQAIGGTDAVNSAVNNSISEIEDYLTKAAHGQT